MSSQEARPAEMEQQEPLVLRPSVALQSVPPEREPALPPSEAASAPVTAASQAAAPAAAAPRPAPMVANAQPAGQSADPPNTPVVLRTDSATWVVAGIALVATVGWVIERRQRRLLESEKDSVMWANVQQGGASIITTAGNLDDILPDSPDPAEAARTIYVTAIGETNSRREATLIDLHQLQGKLKRRRERGDNVAALLLLQQHLVDFRYTSPWVFLELLELYKVLDRQVEWEVAREAFRQRFGQNAPTWSAASTEPTELLEDRQLSKELARDWPYRESRMFILRWMLGEPEMRLKCTGPPLLGLGMYRDLMLLDSILDDVVVVRTQPADSLL